MRNLLERIAAAMRREPPTFKWLEQGPAITDLPPSERDRDLDLDQGHAPTLLDRNS